MKGQLPVSSLEPLDLASAMVVRRLPAIGPSRAILAALWGIAMAAILIPAAALLWGPRVGARYQVLAAIPGRVVPASELPPVEPVALQDLSADDARAYNAGVAFTQSANPAAAPFRLGGGDDRARAVDCLATAVWYEAGDDAIGERAVAQVVLNRVRHPAFPKTVCGVVFQGSERRTGCQFSFTCDGSMERHHPSDIAWKRAREIAAMALAGSTFPPVGWATHYHTDYVVPYWQSSLDKLAEVHTQLFYRWSGWWGTPAAFTRRHEPGEPIEPKMAALSEAHRPVTPALATAIGDPGIAGAPTHDGTPGGGDDLLATLPGGIAPDAYPALAANACGTRAHCRYMAWRDAKHTPAALPLSSEQIGAMSFSYLRDRVGGIDKPLWNCRETPRPAPVQCMKRQVLLTIAPIPLDTEPVLTAGAPPLDGVHRRPPPTATPAPAPSPSAVAGPPRP